MPPSIPVSVVIPCYRCRDTVSRAVDSVSAQSVQAGELILVDDCSNDGTLEELYRLQASYPEGWIKVIGQTANSGAGSARNAGWAAASQPYIAFLDADDIWRREKLSIQYETMRSEPAAAMSGHRCSWPGTGAVLTDIDANPDIRKIDAVSLMIKNRFSTPTVMLRRNIPFRFVDGKRYCEDYDLWLQIVLSGYPALYIDAPLAYLYKAPYGEAGLSAQLWSMEQGELDAYLHLYRRNKIGLPVLSALIAWSFAKYALRLCSVAFRRTN